jgi:hypothetical protein
MQTPPFQIREIEKRHAATSRIPGNRNYFRCLGENIVVNYVPAEADLAIIKAKKKKKSKRADKEKEKKSAKKSKKDKKDKKGKRKKRKD